MDSRDSWIDPDEVSHLAGEIYPKGKRQDARARFVPVSLLDDEEGRGAGGDAASEAIAEDLGADDGARVRRIGEHLQEIRQRAERSGLLIGGEPAAPGRPAGGAAEDSALAPPEHFKLTGGHLVEEVAALVSWLGRFGCPERVFVLDELGDELLAREIPAGLRSGAVRLAQSWERSQNWLEEEGQAAKVALAGGGLADGKTLSVVGVRCGGGFYVAGMVAEQMLSPADAALVRAALLSVFARPARA